MASTSDASTTAQGFFPARSRFDSRDEVVAWTLAESCKTSPVISTVAGRDDRSANPCLARSAGADVVQVAVGEDDGIQSSGAQLRAAVFLVRIFAPWYMRSPRDVRLIRLT